MRATLVPLAVMTGVWLSMSASASLRAQQSTQSPSAAVPAGTQPLPGAPMPSPVVSPPQPPTNIPKRLLAVQQLALAAYPELRNRGLQVRVDETTSGETITFGFADQDRNTILEVSRPREAQLVIDTVFDTQDAVQTALLHGVLAHTKERRQMKAVTTGLAAALSADGAAFGPGNGAALMQKVDLRSLQPILGTLTVSAPVFTDDATDDGLFWQVAATATTGEQMTLGYEPYVGRLVRLVRGGAR